MSRLQFALDYLNYCAKNGAIDESDIEGKTNKELIDMADRMEARADAAYDAWKEQEVESE